VSTNLKDWNRPLTNGNIARGTLAKAMSPSGRLYELFCFLVIFPSSPSQLRVGKVDVNWFGNRCFLDTLLGTFSWSLSPQAGRTESRRPLVCRVWTTSDCTAALIPRPFQDVWDERIKMSAMTGGCTAR